MNMQGVQQSPMQRQQQQQQQQQQHQQQHQHHHQQQRAVAMGSPYASPGNMSAATSPYGQHSPPVTYSSGQQPVPPPTQQTPSKSLSTSVGRSETPGGADHDQLVTELMNQVESKRSELESMTMSVVQWKQNFKDKLKQEKVGLVGHLHNHEHHHRYQHHSLSLASCPPESFHRNCAPRST
jgi:transcription initiation factor TFIID subunit TAF12